MYSFRESKGSDVVDFWVLKKHKLLSYANENDNVNENGNIDLKDYIVYKNDNSADCYENCFSWVEVPCYADLFIHIYLHLYHYH